MFERNLKILIIGDIILDEYVFGDVTRISQEAPVPILNIDKHHNKKYILGGAGNVFKNLISLNEEVYISSVIGKSKNENEMIYNMIKSNTIINNINLVIDESRETTVKTRFVSSSNHHLLRVDKESTFSISTEIADRLINNIKFIKPDCIILQDYAKGVITQYLLDEICKLKSLFKFNLCMDPNPKNKLNYSNSIDIFKPNFIEAVGICKFKENDINTVCNNTELLKELGKELYNINNIKFNIITLSQYGMAVFDDGNLISHEKPVAKEVFDVCGAGDTSMAVLAYEYVMTNNLEYSVKLANCCAGYVVSKFGTYAITKQDYNNCKKNCIQ